MSQLDRPECAAATTRMVEVGIVMLGDLVASYFTTTVVPTGSLPQALDEASYRLKRVY